VIGGPVGTHRGAAAAAGFNPWREQKGARSHLCPHTPNWLKLFTRTVLVVGVDRWWRRVWVWVFSRARHHPMTLGAFLRYHHSARTQSLPAIFAAPGVN